MQKEHTKLPSEFIALDTEFTAWEGSMERSWSGPNEFREVIQIGAVKVRELEEIDTFMCYVRPTKNPQLSEYIQELTGITQETVDTEGLSYEKAQGQFYTWCGGLPLYSIGGNDGYVLKENSDLVGVPFPFGEEAHCSVRAVFAAFGIDTSMYISSTLPEVFGVTPPNKAHDALNDARSILLALQELYKRCN